jgi:hypothetical protein
MMLCLNIVITITINGIIENKKIEKKERTLLARSDLQSTARRIFIISHLLVDSAAVIFLIFRLLDFENRKSILIFENESYICHNGSL